MLSRVAENIYWTARYLERAEDTARLINSTSNLLLDLPRNADVEWYELIPVFGAENQYKELYQDNQDERSVMRYLIADKRNPGSIVNCIVAARENARVSRDIIPYEMWEQANELYHFANEYAQGAVGRRKRNDFTSELIQGCQTMVGITMGTLPHDEAYQFLRIGRNLERADMSSRILDVAAAQLLPDEGEINPAFATVRWIGVLKSLNAFQAYRQQGLVGISGSAVLRYLLQNREFPRSIKHCLEEVKACLAVLHNSEKIQQKLKLLTKELETVDVNELRRAELHQYIDELQEGISNLHASIANTYFL
ncbi:MAG: alpha-E domain-containing protein [Gammaproteobacteria bacterium]|nr:alpha-E domain-containing protein [Gammaproteobacteria bacterium]MDH5692194.1 alpha-E domain-containing protein [Gammaproteobacteria bacterium]